MDGGSSVQVDKVEGGLLFIYFSALGQDIFKTKLFQTAFADKVIFSSEEVVLGGEDVFRNIRAGVVNETEAEGADKERVEVVGGGQASHAEVAVVAVFAGPHFAEAFGGDTGFVERSEAPVAAIDLSLFAALEAVVIVEVVLVDHFLFRDEDALVHIVASLDVFVFGVDGYIGLHNHHFIIKGEEVTK